VISGTLKEQTAVVDAHLCHEHDQIVNGASHALAVCCIADYGVTPDFCGADKRAGGSPEVGLASKLRAKTVSLLEVTIHARKICVGRPRLRALEEPFRQGPGVATRAQHRARVQHERHKKDLETANSRIPHRIFFCGKKL
jgi:hypothetical protein